MQKFEVEIKNEILGNSKREMTMHREAVNA